MSDVSQYNEPKIAVAVALDENASSLVEFSGNLARRLGKKLVLIHALEPWLDLPTSLLETIPLSGLKSVAEEDARLFAENRLDELAQLVPHSVTVEKILVHGKPRSLIPQVAMACRASMLIVGANLIALQNAIPRGLSTILGILPAMTIPLFIFDPKKVPRCLLGDSKFLLADDLSASANASVRFTLEFAAAIGNTVVKHLYVNSLDQEQLATALKSAAAAAHAPFDGMISADSILKQITEELTIQLEDRASTYLDYLESSGGRYEAKVITGSIRNALALETLDFCPDVLVFGKHKALHTDSLLLGRMPYRAMLSLGLPLLIVPADPSA